MKEAADILAESPCAMQLRYLQTLNNIATEQNSTIIFPLPMDLIPFFHKPRSNLTKSTTQPFVLTPTSPDETTSSTTGRLISTDI